MKNIKNLSIGILLFIFIVITGNSFTGKVVQQENTARYSFTWVNILFFFLIMVFIMWLVNYIKNGDNNKQSKNNSKNSN